MNNIFSFGDLNFLFWSIVIVSFSVAVYYGYHKDLYGQGGYGYEPAGKGLYKRRKKTCKMLSNILQIVIVIYAVATGSIWPIVIVYSIIYLGMYVGKLCMYYFGPTNQLPLHPQFFKGMHKRSRKRKLKEYQAEGCP